MIACRYFSDSNRLIPKKNQPRKRTQTKRSSCQFQEGVVEVVEEAEVAAVAVKEVVDITNS